MAKLKTRYSKQEDIPADFVSLYVQNGEVWELDVNPVDGFALSDTTTGKTAIQKERDNARAAERKLKDALAERDELQVKLDAKPKNAPAEDIKAAVESATKQLEEKHQKQLADKDTQLARQDSLLDNLSRVREAQDAIAKHGGKAKVLLPKVLPQLRRKTIDGQVKVIVVDENGNELISRRPDNNGSMEADELVAWLKEDADWSFAFDGKPGTGSGGGGAGGVKPTSSGVISSEDQEALNANIEDIAAGKIIVT